MLLPLALWCAHAGRLETGNRLGPAKSQPAQPCGRVSRAAPGPCLPPAVVCHSHIGRTACRNGRPLNQCHCVDAMARPGGGRPMNWHRCLQFSRAALSGSSLEQFLSELSAHHGGRVEDSSCGSSPTHVFAANMTTNSLCLHRWTPPPPLPTTCFGSLAARLQLQSPQETSQAAVAGGGGRLSPPSTATGDRHRSGSKKAHCRLSGARHRPRHCRTVSKQH